MALITKPIVSSPLSKLRAVPPRDKQHVYANPIATKQMYMHDQPPTFATREGAMYGTGFINVTTPPSQTKNNAARWASERVRTVADRETPLQQVYPALPTGDASMLGLDSSLVMLVGAGALAYFLFFRR